MRAISMDHLVAPLDYLFESGESSAGDFPRCRVGIGDGGNELGMGNVLHAVREHIPRGEVIGASVGCDHLLAAGVSNWGGYALAAALGAVAIARGRCVALVAFFLRRTARSSPPASARSFPSGDEAARHVLPSRAMEECVMTALMEANCRDGITGELCVEDGQVFAAPVSSCSATPSGNGPPCASARGTPPSSHPPPLPAAVAWTECHSPNP